MKSRAASAGGFSLVEMMVALGLGMALSLVVVQLFNNTRQANRVTEDSARIQESVRYATEVIGRTVRIAGYKSNPTAVSATVFPTGALALEGVDGTGTASDTLTIRYQGAGPATGTADNTILDCLGNAVAPDYAGVTTAYNKFSIAADADGNNALYCSNSFAVNPGTLLVPGVEAMQVIFGEDTTGTPDGSADRFVPVGSLTAVTGLDNVVVVRVYLLFSGGEKVRLNTAAANFTLAGVAYSYSDQKIRRAATVTVVLRNRAP